MCPVIPGHSSQAAVAGEFGDHTTTSLNSRLPGMIQRDPATYATLPYIGHQWASFISFHHMLGLEPPGFRSGSGSASPTRAI